jgi:hypothetical protein
VVELHQARGVPAELQRERRSVVAQLRAPPDRRGDDIGHDVRVVRRPRLCLADGLVGGHDGGLPPPQRGGRSYKGNNVDPIADIYIFDIGGIVLFTSGPVRRFFSEELHLTDWSLQPSFALNNGTLQNNGQYFSLKWKFPFSDSWSLFHYFGLRGLFGASRRFDNGDAISVGAGVRAVSLKLLDPNFFLLTTVLKWETGIFYDRNNSLLASLFVGGADDNPVTLNIYPGVVRIAGISPGLWALHSDRYGFSFGITTVWAPGVGATTKEGKTE